MDPSEEDDIALFGYEDDDLELVDVRKDEGPVPIEEEKQ